MAIQVIFHVTGTGQLNGNLRIDKTVEMDNEFANKLRVDKKALLKYVETQYPGATISENSLTVRVLPIPRNAPTEKQENKENKRNEKEKADVKLQKTLDGAKIKVEKTRNKAETERINQESEIEKLKHRIEAESLKGELDKIRLQNRQQKIDELNNSYKERTKDFIYYLKLSWTYLDKGWKKALAIYILLAIIGGIYTYIAELMEKP